MRESLENALEELKRVDHSIFVSLKYTRTVDVLVNILVRMVDCYEHLMTALLKHAVEKKMCLEIPSTPKEKAVALKQLFKEQEIHDNVDLYLLLKAMMKSNHSRENEYRRHVAMRAIIAGREEIININIISQYYEFLTSFFHLVDNIRKGTYIVGSGRLIGEGIEETTDEENPNNPYWAQVKQMKEEADAEIARDKIIRERIRQEKAQRDQERIKQQQKEQEREEKKLKRITKRKPKIAPKKVISKEKLKMMELKKIAQKRIAQEKKKKSKKKK